MNKLIILIIVLLFNSCKDAIGPDYFDRICEENSRFKVDSSRVSYVTEANHEYLSIRSIAIPSDTFFIRIEYSTDTTLKLFEYSFYKSRTSYKIYTFPVDNYDGRILFDKAKDTLTSFVQNIDLSGIDESFIRQLEEKNICKLPSSSSLKSYPEDWDRSYMIEYSNKCKYSIVLFTDPFQNSKKFKEAKNLVDFLEYLKKEFNF